MKNSIKSISTTLKSPTLKSSSSSSMFLLWLVVLLEMYWWDYFNLFSVDPLKTSTNFSVLSSNHLFLISRLFSLWPAVVTCKLLLTCSLSTSPSQTFLSSSSVLLSPSSKMSPTLGSLEQSCAELSYSLRYYQSTFIFISFHCCNVLFVHLPKKREKKTDKFKLLFQNVSMSVSVLTLTAIAYDRYKGG